MHSTVLVELLLFGKNVWRICYLSEHLLVLLLPTENVPIQELPCKLPKILLSIWTFWVARGKFFSNPTPRGLTFSGVTVSFGRNSLYSKEHIQRFWNWHPSIRRAVFLERVFSVRTREHHWAICCLSQMFSSVLAYCWVVLQIYTICRMDHFSQSSWEYNLCNTSRFPSFATGLFRFGKSKFV